MKGLIPTSLASFTTVGCLFSTVPVLAQIVPDNTLGPDSSIVVPNQTIRGVPSDRIDGGAVRGNNLFHSFEEFNVDVGRGAFFANPENIANILSRVTGGNISNILGTLGVLGDANLFLVNPNGIVFGPNARLDVSGSFFATTNNGFIFENGFEFVASNSDAPPLLTINIPIGLRLRENPGTIENQSVAFNPNTGGLQVPFGRTLGLVGGEIIVNNGALIAPGGQLELAGVSGVGTIQLDTEENNINGLQISSPVTREDITLTNGAILDVVSSRGGDITIDGRNVNISDFSRLFAGIAPEEGNPETQAGDIEINASENFQLLNGSLISNELRNNAQGNAGDIRITANNIFVRPPLAENTDELTVLSSRSSGRGNAGNITLTANNRTSFEGRSVAFSTIEPTGEGLGGNIRIVTGDLSMSDGPQLQTLVRGTGDAGNIDITASRSVSLSGSLTRFLSSIQAGGIGNSGDINITTDSLSVSNGASLLASVREPDINNMLPAGQGNAGIININATGRVSFDGVDSGAFSELEFRPLDENQETLESGGSIQINAGSVFVTNGAKLRVSTDRRGDAGNITINAQNLVSFDGFREVLDNEGNVIRVRSGASSTVGRNGEGRSNGIEINTGSLRVTNGALLDVATFGQGNAGQLTINATGGVTFSNGATAFSRVEPEAIGNSAGININATNLRVTNGASLDAATFGEGNAGSVTINTPNNGSVIFDQESRAFSAVEASATGDGGNIEINTGSLSVTNGAQLRAETRGEGNADSIIINAPNGSVIFDGASESGQLSSAFSTVELGAVGDGGNIEITTSSLSVTNGAQLRAETQGEGNADSIIINAPNGSVIFDGVSELGSPSRAVSVVTQSATGEGGNIEITTGSLSVTNGALLDAATFGDGDAGSVIVQASGDVLFDGFFENEAGERSRSAAFSTVEPNIEHPDNQGGNIEISARNLTVSNGAQLRAETERQGNAGNIIINTTENLFVTDNAALDVSTFNQGNAGDIIVQAQGDVLFDEATAFSTVARFAQGNSGNIDITAGNLSVINGGQLRVEVEPSGTGNAGNIFVNAADSVIFDGIGESGRLSGAFSSLEENATGEAGSIDISANRNVAVTDGAQLQVQTSGFGNAGNINIFAGDSVLFSGGAVGVNFNPFTSGAFSLVDSSGIGNSGDISITTGTLNVLNGATLETAVRIGIVPGRVASAGEIRIDAEENVTFDGVGTINSFQQVGEAEQLIDPDVGQFFPSQAITSVDSGVAGNSGNVIINADNLGITNGAQLQASNSGSGSAGDIDINVRNNVIFDGVGLGESVSQASTKIGVVGEGVGGNVEIDAINLSVTNGAQLEASIEKNAIGVAGDILVNTRDNTFFDGIFLGESGAAYPSRAATTVGENTFGIGGEVNITTTNLSVTNGARLDVRTFGLLAEAGNVTIKASENILFDGVFEAVEGQLLFLDGQPVSRIFSGAFTTAEVFTDNEFTGIGFGGDITLIGENISLSNSAQLKTAASGLGIAGDIFVTTGNLFATNGAQIQAQVDGIGAAGNVGITASNSISIDNSTVFTTVEAGSFGDGGSIEINTGNLFVTNGGQLQAQVNEDAEGNAGNITINASDSVFFDGVSVEGLPSQAFTSVGLGAVGTGGDVTINAQNLSVTNGAGLFASTLGVGDAGNITIYAQEDVYFDNTGAFSTVEEGRSDVIRNNQGGTIEITAENLFLTNGAELSASNNLPDPGSKAGNIEIEAETINMDNLSLIETNTEGGDGGNIGINSRDVIMRDGSQILTDAGRAGLPGNGGNITINTELLVGLNRSHIAANAYLGQGGTIEINADGVFVFEVYSRERLEELFGADALEMFDPTELPRSSITSISLTNPSLSGIVEINDFDPTTGLIELPRIVVDPNDLINQDPCKQGQESELYIRGRGGIQVTPDDKLDGGEIDVDLVEPTPSRQRNRRNSSPDRSRTKTEENQQISSLDIVPARGWIRDENGDVILVDYDPTQTGVQRPQHRQQNPNICQPVSENPR